MIYAILKKITGTVCNVTGIKKEDMSKTINKWSLRKASSEAGLRLFTDRLRMIVPDISNQEESEKGIFNDYWELKRRTLQAFQCSLMMEAVKTLPPGELIVVDIGDSAGTHMLYLKELAKDKHKISTISVNLDPRAVEKIKARGLSAILCRAEDLDLGEKAVSLFTAFQMIEHLHNPAIFLRKLAKSSPCSRMVITVPYLKHSRLGLHHLKSGAMKKVYAEDEHIFELNPDDWTSLFLHSGWRVAYSKVYWQYPVNLPLVSKVLSWYWRAADFEGFWGAILEKDTALSDLYQDWEK